MKYDSPYTKLTNSMNENKIPVPLSSLPRVVIIGAGFAGLRLARLLSADQYQVVLLDKNNYHQFQPLFYQVAMSGLEPSSIVFPLRKMFQQRKNFYFRSLEVKSVDSDQRRIYTDFGWLEYDYLVLAMGADTNFFGNKHISDRAIPMKSVSEALFLRNRILSDLERAVNVYDFQDRQSYIDIVIVGGGATGVEVAGALAEMKKFILPKDYKELNAEEIDIHLVEAGPKLLPGMSEKSSRDAEKFLINMGVLVKTNAYVADYDGYFVTLGDGSKIVSRKLIWAAGVTGNTLEGLPDHLVVKNGRIKVDRKCRLEGFDNIFAIGDVAYMEEPAWPKGHPQVAQVALQQGTLVAENFKRKHTNRKWKDFTYKDLGSLATVGRNKAVADLPGFKTSGFWAWIIWLWVHLLSLVGVKNKFLVFINWVINYMTYDPSLRLIIRPKIPPQPSPGPMHKQE
jgi:NADH:ubiquinone reductase (H+-translocating)